MNLEHEAEELVTVNLEGGGWLSPTKITIWVTLCEAKMDGFLEAMNIVRAMPVYSENIAYAVEAEQRLLRQFYEMKTQLDYLKKQMENKVNESR